MLAGIALMAHSDVTTFWPSAIGILGAAASIFLFSRGFRMLQYKRLILNTPVSKIRSASMGLVEVSGMPVGPQTLTSPVTGEPCFYYSVRAWQWNQSGGRGSWNRVLDESVCLSFFVEDNTGKVLVNPQGAHLELHRDFYDEVSAWACETPGLLPDQLRKFLAWRGLVPYSKIRIEERVIKPDYPLFVFGTLGDNPGSCWSPRPHVAGTKPSADLGLTDLSLLSRATSGDGLDGKLAAGLAQFLGLNVWRATTTSRLTTDARLPYALEHTAVALPPAAGGAATHSVPVSTSERLGSSGQFASQHDSVTPNTSASEFDLHARLAIGKGERGDPFVISSESQREVVQSLSWKSTALIWGSALLTLAFVYSLIALWAVR